MILMMMMYTYLKFEQQCAILAWSEQKVLLHVKNDKFCNSALTVDLARLVAIIWLPKDAKL